MFITIKNHVLINNRLNIACYMLSVKIDYTELYFQH